MSNTRENILKLAENSKLKAISHLQNDNAGRALAHFLVALNLVPEWKDNLRDVFLTTIVNFGNTLLYSGRLKEYITCYSKALEIYPDNTDILKNLAEVLVSMGHYETACGFYQKCVNIDSADCIAQKASDDLKNTLVERWHYRMLNDKRRNSAYMDAILNEVKNTDKVLDIGCGTGILSIFASKAMPKELHATDSSEIMFNIAKSVFKENGVDSIKVYNEKSSDLSADKLTGRVSLVITEIFDGAIFGEGILQALEHAHKELLDKSGKVVPKSASLFICGVRSQKLARKHRFIHRNGEIFDGLKFGDINIFHATQEPYDTEDVTRFEDLEFATDIQIFLDVDFMNLEQIENLLVNHDAIDDIFLNCQNGGTIDALIVWFELKLTDNISITTDPRSNHRSKAWEQAVFYLNIPLHYNSNDKIPIKMSCVSGKLTLLNQNNVDEFDCPVSLQTIKILNDFGFINIINKTVGVACIHICQAHDLKHLRVLDMTSFPIFGLLFLARGAYHLTCSPTNEADKNLVMKIAAVNDISFDRIQFITNDFKDMTNNSDKKFEIIVNNYFFGNGLMCELNEERIKMGQTLRIKKLNRNGVMIPFQIKMMARLIYSDELNRINKLDDQNAFNCKIAQFLNLYTVSQNYIGDMSTFPYKSMSDDLVLFDQCLHPRSDKALEIVFKETGTVNAVLTWFEVQFIKDSKVYSTLDRDSQSECCIHLTESELHVNSGEEYSLFIWNGQNGFIKIGLHSDISNS